MLRANRQARRFVILFPGRSGGSYLASALEQHPDVRILKEPLGVRKQSGTRRQMRWLRRYLRGRDAPGARAIGITTKFIDLADEEAFRAELRRQQARIVLLVRSNDVKHAVSMMRARVLNDTFGIWNRSGSDPELGPVTIDPEEFGVRLERGRQRKEVISAYAEGLGLPLLRVDYRELLVEPQPTFVRVFEHLGVPPLAVTGSTAKTTSDDLRESISNFDDLRARYAGTEYEAMFDEVLRP
jgi:hypothetical protein